MGEPIGTLESEWKALMIQIHSYPTGEGISEVY